MEGFCSSAFPWPFFSSVFLQWFVAVGDTSASFCLAVFSRKDTRLYESLARKRGLGQYAQRSICEPGVVINSSHVSLLGSRRFSIAGSPEPVTTRVESNHVKIRRSERARVEGVRDTSDLSGGGSLLFLDGTTYSLLAICRRAASQDTSSLRAGRRLLLGQPYINKETGLDTASLFQPAGPWEKIRDMWSGPSGWLSSAHGCSGFSLDISRFFYHSFSWIASPVSSTAKRLTYRWFLCECTCFLWGSVFSENGLIGWAY